MAVRFLMWSAFLALPWAVCAEVPEVPAPENPALAVVIPDARPEVMQALIAPNPRPVAGIGRTDAPQNLPPRQSLRPPARPQARSRPPRESDRPIPRPAAVYGATTGRLSEPPPECDAGEQVCIRIAYRLEDTCAAIQTLAKAEGLPPGYFARLIWRESLFDPYAISHAGAMGIAQFMPGTARLRGLNDPFNPAAALAASANYLAELTDKFGNLGLAAVAYNGGEDRAARFKAHQSGLPDETRAYVVGITGHSAEVWRDAPPETIDLRLDGAEPFLSACITKGTERAVPQFASNSDGSGRGAQSPWVVVITAHANKDVARARYNAAASRSPQLRATPATVTRVKLSGMRNAQYTAQISQPNRSAALILCNEIRRSGVPCLVRKN